MPDDDTPLIERLRGYCKEAPGDSLAADALTVILAQRQQIASLSLAADQYSESRDKWFTMARAAEGENTRLREAAQQAVVALEAYAPNHDVIGVLSAALGASASPVDVMAELREKYHQYFDGLDVDAFMREIRGDDDDAALAGRGVGDG